MNVTTGIVGLTDTDSDTDGVFPGPDVLWFLSMIGIPWCIACGFLSGYYSWKQGKCTTGFSYFRDWLCNRGPSNETLPLGTYTNIDYGNHVKKARVLYRIS